MQQIKDWLSGKRNFIIGRAIYRALISSDDDLIRLFDKGCTQYSHQQLVNALQSYTDASGAPESTGGSQEPEKRSDEPEMPRNQLNDDDLHVQADPNVLQAIHNEWQVPYKKMHYLIGKLDQFGESNDPAAIAERMDLAEQIIELEKIVNGIWAKKDEYIKTGRLTAAVIDDLIIPADPVELAELINRIKKGIRNNRIRMQKFPDKPAHAERYQMYKLQYFKVTGKHYQDQV